MSQYTSKIVQHMQNKSNIRNFSIVSHVDHGKTTLADHILQAGGLISKTLAGSAKVLDYLNEEQERGITIKTANISFLHQDKENTYLMNLIDTPGHVDFSGMVSQALRLVDGTIIVVDAVEGVMAQTDSVIKQAMKEGLKPILFINKIDRLINELKLDEKEIESRLSNIIQLVNELITQYGEKQEKKAWKVDFTKGTIVIGAALYGWAISKYSTYVPKFREIIQFHQQKNIDDLKEKYPIISSLMPVIINSIPSPIEAQKQRINQITEIIGEKQKTDIVNCDSKGEIILCVGKLLYEKNRGLIIVARVFSGTIKKGSQIKNLRTNKKLRINQVCIYKGEKLIKVDKVEAGNIAAIIGLEEVKIGDTLLELDTSEDSILFKQIIYLQESVIALRIEPISISDLPKLQKQLEIQSLIKPNFRYIIDEDTGQIKLFGIGELQLEIITNEIRKEDIRIEVSEPEVAFAEQINRSVEYVGEDLLEKIQISLVCKPHENEVYDNVIYEDFRKNVLIIEEETLNNQVIDLIKTGFRNAIKKGVKTSNPIRNLIVNIKNIKKLEEDAFRYEIIIPAIKRIIHKALEQGEIDVYEPYYEIQITSPTHFMGQILTVLQKFGGKIEKTEHLSSRAIVNGKISVESSLSLANELRHASEGFAFWQFKLAGYQKKKNT